MKNPVVHEIITYIKDKYGAEPEYLWAETPGNGIFRHRENRKWFAVLIAELPKNKMGLPREGRADVLNLKCDPRIIGSLHDGRHILPGYHMNKEHWLSIVLDRSLNMSDVYPLIDMSFDLTSSKK